MTDSAPTPDTVLRLAAATDPAPWFPSQYAHDAGIDRNSLDDPLNQLRIAGLVRIGGWEAGRGQCYVLTDAGRAAMAAPGDLPRLLNATNASPPAASPRTVRSTAWDRGEAVRGAFFADSRTPVLYVLVAIQVLAFIAGLVVVMRAGAPIGFYLERGLVAVPVHGGGQAGLPALESMVLFTPDLGRGQWWQLLTYAFVHFGLLHLGMNLYGHYALGPLVERMYGSARFLVLYLLSAFGGGIAAVLLGGPEAHTAGSSGALCGLIGGFAAFVILNRRHLGGELFDQCRRWLGNTVVLLILFSMLPQVSWQCHLGGTVAGFVAGVLLTYHRFGTAEQRWAALLGLVLLPIAGLTPLVEKGIFHEPAPPPPEMHIETPVPPAVQLMHFNSLVGKPTELVRLQAAAVSDQFVDRVRDERPETRDPQFVRVAREALATLRSNQERARSQIARIHPYAVPAIEAARQAALQYLTAALALTSALDACLEQGPDWNTAKSTAGEPATQHRSDELQLQQLANDATEAALQWRKLGRIAISSGPTQSKHPHGTTVPIRPLDGSPPAAPR